jgi:hypothetical protein
MALQFHPARCGGFVEHKKNKGDMGALLADARVALRRRSSVVAARAAAPHMADR